jgi:pimeloyl-ACP methyl ester carboxylesterase
MRAAPGNGPAEREVIGTGRDALLLPALSSISTRREMLPLARSLAAGMRCTVVDWPGFGDHPRARLALSADALRAFLDTLLAEDAGRPIIGIAAGHGATYLVDAARRHPGRFSHLVLVAPTWRGPLPTMLAKQGPAKPGLANPDLAKQGPEAPGATLRRRVRRAIELPVLGDLLYRLSVSRPVVTRMMRAHVYADPGQVTPGVLDDKLGVTRQPRARFGTAAFISGGLDPVASRAAFLALFEGRLPPTLLLRPRDAPPKSGEEMDALAASGRVSTVSLPGALAMHEEHADGAAAAILRFVDG